MPTHKQRKAFDRKLAKRRQRLAGEAFTNAQDDRHEARAKLRQVAQLALAMDPDSLPSELRALRLEAAALLDRAERSERHAQMLKRARGNYSSGGNARARREARWSASTTPFQPRTDA